MKAKYLLILLILLNFVFSFTGLHGQDFIEEEKESTSEKLYRKRLRAIDLFYYEYYEKYNFPLAFPQLKENSTITPNYSYLINNLQNPYPSQEKCSIPGAIMFKDIPQRRKDPFNRDLEEIAAYNACLENAKRENNKIREEISTDKEQKDWRRSRCKNKKILLLLDLQYFLESHDKIYKACIEIKEPLEEIEFIRSTKRYIYELIQPILMEPPKEFPEVKGFQKKDVQEIFNDSQILLIEYGNFSTYYKSHPILENKYYGNFDYLFEEIHPKEKSKNFYNHILLVKNHKEILFKNELRSGKVNGLIEYNKELLRKMAKDLESIAQNQYILSKNKKVFQEIFSCLNTLSDAHLEIISVSYTSGLFSKYGNSIFNYDNRANDDTEFKEIVNIYHKNFFQSKLLELRLSNRLNNCNLVRKTPADKLTLKEITNHMCNIINSPDCPKEYYEF